MANRGKAVKLRVAPALHQIMEPDDQIIAGFAAMIGPSPMLLARVPGSLVVLPTTAATVLLAIVRKL